MDNDDMQAAGAALGQLIIDMSAARPAYQERARAWIASPEFKALYEEAHPGLLLKGLANVLGSGKSWLGRSSQLWRDYQRLGTEGELRFCAPVIANPALSLQPERRLPAAVVAAREQDPGSLVQIGELGTKLGGVYTGRVTGTMPGCRAILAEDDYRPLRQRPLPATETHVFGAVLYDVRMSATDLMFEEGNPFLPLLVDPSGRAFIIVPWHVVQGRPAPVLPSPAPPSRPVPPPMPTLVPPPLPSGGEVSPGGSVIRRYNAPTEGDLAGPDLSGSSIKDIEAHIAEHIGNVDSVFHELISDRVHLDVHIIRPTSARPYITLITSGMSDLPMTVPADAAQYRFAELMLCLPPDWPLGESRTAGADPSEGERHYWPIRWLKRLARFPHEYGTWLGEGHTLPNGNPAEPLAEGCPFTGFVLVPALSAPEEFQTLFISPEKAIHFYSIVPLTTAEMNFKLEHGAIPLFTKFAAADVTDLVDVKRKSVV